jgi:hypothetical protein
MKKLLSIIATLFLFSNVNAQVSNADSMVHKIFRTIKAQDEKSFLALFPNYNQMKVLMKSVLMQDQLDEDKESADSSVNLFVESITEEVYRNEMQKEFLETYKKLSEQGNEIGLNFKNLQLTNYTIVKNPAPDSKVNTMNGILFIKDGSKDYHIPFNQVIWDDKEKGWFGVSFKDLQAGSQPIKEQ